ncbi:tetratricopeptide repeat protein [uncultured Clostridium sp.]|uniref:tetratricopeptide repeat protein n=1 Tax=uncultured Clostridium sp. TaxID=59620 RepID=UPI002611B792|nr:tetratricopeptide repeat protein [uncultured Clostridium sp.]
MNISNKKLKKALENYKNGDYESALKICEKFLEKDYSNEEALSLEGDILYKLGRIDDAIVTWKINSEYNQNEEATNRLAAVDKERKAQALSYTNIQNMSSEDRVLLENAYRENIELKKQVESSNFLSDKDSKHVEEPKSAEHLDVLQNNDSFEPVQDDMLNNKEYEIIETNIDDLIESPSTNNELEDINIDEFKDRVKHLEAEPSIAKKVSVVDEDDSYKDSFNPRPVTATKKASSKKKIIIISTIAVVAVIIVAISYSKMHSNTKNEKSASINKTDVVQPATDKTVPVATKPKPAPTVKMLTDAQVKTYNTDVAYLISQNSIDGIKNVLINTPKDTIPAAAMESYNNALSFMKSTGITYYFTNGMTAYKANDYATAVSYFSEAQPFAHDDFRGATMLFLSAVSYQKLDNLTLAVSTYKDFLKEYPNSTEYTPETLYFLANYYSEHNSASQAKDYANQLATKFPGSMYNNTELKKIIG